MYTTLTLIAADAGHAAGCPASAPETATAVRRHVAAGAGGLLTDSLVYGASGGLALLLVHDRGVGDDDVLRLGRKALQAGKEAAAAAGSRTEPAPPVYSFEDSRDRAPAVVEITFQERPDEPVLVFVANGADPAAYNLPVYRAFADPMNTAGLLLSPEIAKGFRFRLLDTHYADGDRLIDLTTPEDLHDLAALLCDDGRYLIQSVCGRHDGDQSVSVSTGRPSGPGGADGPAMLVRVQGNFPAAGEVLAPFGIGPYIGGFVGHVAGLLMPVRHDALLERSGRPPAVSCLGFHVRDGRLTEPGDLFDHPFWDAVRGRVAGQAGEIRRQQNGTGSYSERHYGDTAHVLERLQQRFHVRRAPRRLRAAVS